MPDITELPASPEAAPTLTEGDVRNKINEVVIAMNDLEVEDLYYYSASTSTNQTVTQNGNVDLTDLITSPARLHINTNASKLSVSSDQLSIGFSGIVELEFNFNIFNSSDFYLELLHNGTVVDYEYENSSSNNDGGSTPLKFIGNVTPTDTFEVISRDNAVEISESDISIKQLPSKTAINATDTPVSDQSDFIAIGTKLIQTGTYTGGSHADDIVFPTTFADADYSFVVAINYAGLDKVFQVTTSAQTPSQIHFDKVFLQSGSSTVGNASGETFDWIAIGTKPQS